MRAPHPALQRLYRLAGIPTQRSAAWRAIEQPLARLAPVPVAAAQHNQDRLVALLQGRQSGAGLTGTLARLLGPVAGSNDSTAEPGLQRPPMTAAGQADAHGVAGSLPRRPAVATRADGRPAWRQDGALSVSGAAPVPMINAGASNQLRHAAGRKPGLPATAAEAAAAGAATPGLTARTGTPDAPATLAVNRWPPLLAARLATAPPGRGIGPFAAARSDGLQPMLANGPQGWPDRLQQIGQLAAWRTPLARPTALADDGAAGSMQPLAPGKRRASAVATDAPADPSNAQATDARAADAPPSLFSPALGRALDKLPASASWLAGGAGSALAASDAGALPLIGAALSALPDGTRVGGFRGLAALGRQAAPVLSQVAPNSAASPAAMAAVSAMPRAPVPEPAGAPLTTQALIDQIEAALREQAERNGIVLGGIDP